VSADSFPEIQLAFSIMSIIQNERLKYIANAFDRASTSCLTVGVFAPIAAALYTSASAQIGAIQFASAVAAWIFCAAILHLLGRVLLRRLQ
jgi:hypothetical protein